MGLAESREAGWELPDAIYTHGTVESMNHAYRETGIKLPATCYVANVAAEADWSHTLVIVPLSAHGIPWSRRFGPASLAFASGWMRVRGTRRRRTVDRGFVLSDHVDWPGLLTTIDTTGAETIFLTHGYTNVVARWSCEQGNNAQALAT